MTGENLKSLFTSIINRTVFAYTTKNVWEYIVFCVRCRKRGSLKRNKLFRKQYLYSRGVGKLQQELDAIHILRTLRQQKLLSSVMLSEKQRVLL